MLDIYLLLRSFIVYGFTLTVLYFVIKFAVFNALIKYDTYKDDEVRRRKIDEAISRNNKKHDIE